MPTNTPAKNTSVEPIAEPPAEIVFQPELTKGEMVGFSIAGAVVVGFLGFMTFLGIKEEQKKEEERLANLAKLQEKRQARIDWLNAEAEKGNVVYELKGGEYLVVPRNASGVRTIVR